MSNEHAIVVATVAEARSAVSCLASQFGEVLVSIGGKIWITSTEGASISDGEIEMLLAETPRPSVTPFFSF